jgi:dihydrofolate reductase
VLIPRADLDAYASQRGRTLGGTATTPRPNSGRTAPTPRRRAGGASAQAQQATFWQDLAEEQARELYVVSSTLKDPDWNNSTVLAGDVVQEVSKLKEELDGEIVVAGSIRLVRTLLENDLADELRLMIYPVVLGAGERLFGETSDQRPVRLVETRTRRRPRLPHLRGRRRGLDAERRWRCSPSAVGSNCLKSRHRLR